MESNQTPSVSQHQNNRALKIATLIVVTILIAVVSSFATYYFLNKQFDKKLQLMQKANQVPIVSPTTFVTIPTPTFYPVDSNPNLKRHISEKFGITFTYLKNQSPERANAIEVLEENTKIYIGGKEGQWVEVFDKNPKDSLEEAIRKRILTNYSPTDCFVEKSKITNSSYPPTFEQAHISFPKTNDENDPFSESTAKKCPSDYRETNGIRFFLQDNNFPNKFFFFSIGQYAILADGNKSWFDTFQVLK